MTQRRDRVWLARWLAEPDKVLAEGDPQALALRARYKDMVMPNLRLTPDETRALMAFIEEESQRVEQQRLKLASATPACCH